jgi:hypothetical protein
MSFSGHSFELNSSRDFTDSGFCNTSIRSSHVYISACNFLNVILVLLSLFPICSTLSLGVTSFVIILVLFLNIFG